MKIRIVDHSGSPYVDHPGFGPWFIFEEQIKLGGHVIIKDSFEVQSDVNIVNCYSKDIIKKSNSFEKKISNLLVIWEPEVTNSKIYTRKYLDHFKVIYCPSKFWAERVKGKNFNWPAIPVKNTIVTPDQWLKRQNKAVMVLSNKFSSHKNELYSLRRKLALIADESTLSVFGIGWSDSFILNAMKWIKSVNRSGLRNIRLLSLFPLKARKWNRFTNIVNKYDALSGFRISVVIENSNDYISEKIFDSLYSQNIVIYVGPNLDKFNLSEDLVISVPNNIDDLNAMINEVIGLDDDKQLEILEIQQRRYLEECSSWNNDLVMKQLANQILEDLK